MNLEQFRYLCEIAKYRSFSKAAKNLYITQPSLSVSIQKLESELGFSVFTRSSAGVALTKEGKELLKIAGEITGQMEKIRTLTDGKKKEAAILPIAVVPVCCSSIVMRLIELQKREKICFSMDIKELRPGNILRSVLDGDSLIGIGSYTPATKEEVFKKAHENGLFIESLLEDHMAVFLPGSHPLSRKPGLHMADLQNETPILFQNFEVVEEEYRDSTAKHEIGRSYYCFSDRGSIKEAIANGLGFAVLPYLMSVGDLFTDIGKIAVVPLLNGSGTFGLYLIYSKSKRMADEEKWLIRNIHIICKELKLRLEQYWNRFETSELQCTPDKLYY